MDGQDRLDFIRRAGANTWTIPILARMHHLRPTVGGTRTAMLLHQLGCSRSSLRAAMNVLIRDLMWVQRHPGYGHPLRPEFTLTAAGAEASRWAAGVHEVVAALGVEGAAYRKWSLPAIYALAEAEGELRFSQVQEALGEITPRALAAALKQLHAAGLVERTVEEGYPPVPLYRLTASGGRVAAAME